MILLMYGSQEIGLERWWLSRVYFLSVWEWALGVHFLGGWERALGVHIALYLKLIK